jgi:hypothetical protein
MPECNFAESPTNGYRSQAATTLGVLTSQIAEPGNAFVTAVALAAQANSTG